MKERESTCDDLCMCVLVCLCVYKCMCVCTCFCVFERRVYI